MNQNLRFSIAHGAACALLSFTACSNPGARPDNPWARVTGPAPGAPYSIGHASAGCIRGAVSLPPDGPGYRVMRISRKRFYGHPVFIHYIEELGKAVLAHRLPPILVGDIGQARGGPMPTGHISHQIGLDGDIWLERFDGPVLTLDDRERISARSMVLKDGSGLDPANWDSSREWVLREAVSFDEVDRIFVNPVIKRALCHNNPKAQWLAKLRPWWGHDDHFHVRLKCPADDAACGSTADAIPPGNGCDASLDWWFGDEAKKKGVENTKKYGVQELPKLPEECQAVLNAPDL